MKEYPLVFRITLTLPRPHSNDKRADVERLKDVLSLNSLEIPLCVMKELPDVLRTQSFKTSPLIGRLQKGYIMIEPHSNSEPYGVAVDIGTTNITASLWELSTHQMLSRKSIVNPQIEYGVDILSRIHHSMLGGGEQLHKSLLEGVNSLVEELSGETAVPERNLCACSIAANTTMTHFLMGLEVKNIPVEPYIPVVYSPGVRIADEMGIRINPRGVVYIFPNAGSYVGGDIIAGILATGIHKSEEVSVLIDVGTNAEIVVGTKDWIMVGAGAAGPALEDGILSSGMRAEDGAIYRIDIKDKRIVYKTIGDAPARGICGSGVIDLIAELYRTGRIDSLGRFTNKAEVDTQGEEPFFEVTNVNGRRIGITEREINNFLRTKAAMFTSLYVLLHDLGLSFSDVYRYYIAGAMGSGVRIEKAQLLGMLPLVPEDRFTPVGNSALKGAEAVLLNGDLIKEAEEIRSIITYKEMNTEPEFMKNFPSALFIPHSDPEILK
jgi:uncharacterized 2Fe-2S/4Fe-4S cluster protein (DUF4445 family)